MTFVSFDFVVFFFILTSLYFLTPYRFRWALLLFSSCYFYMAFIPYYILILWFTIVIDYAAGLWIEKAKTPGSKKAWLIASLCANIGVLAFFKYYNFFIENLFGIVTAFEPDAVPPLLNIILPIGLSFHTFQAMSYTIEVYRGKFKAERHFGIYALYVMFYPQLVAGPIERPQNILPQLHLKFDFEYQRVADGLKLMAWGFFKKIVIADRLAIYVNDVYNNAGEFHGFPLIIATLFFTIQIYCDFSGYSDIAIGSAQVMGVKLMDNFNRPYFSKSIGEFWRRWHISLSTWFRDYLYIPLGGSRVSILRNYYNLAIVFLISGLWHGANWTFIIWGGLHAFFIITELATREGRKNISSWFERNHAGTVFRFSAAAVTFCLVAFAWIFFRANTLYDAMHIVANLFTKLSLENLSHGISLFTGYQWLLAVGAVLFMVIVHLMQRHYRMRAFLSGKPAPLRWAIYILLIASIILFGEYSSSEFLYFQF